jgi:hypothetical protein
MLFRENNTFLLCVEVITILKNSIFWVTTTCNPLKFKGQLTLNGLHGVISQKIELFITTAVRTSDPAIVVLVFVVEITLVCMKVIGSKYNQKDQVKEDEMGRACSMNREKRNACRLLVGNPEGKRPLGRPRRRWVDNIKMEFREIGWSGMDWIDLAQDREQ